MFLCKTSITNLRNSSLLGKNNSYFEVQKIDGTYNKNYLRAEYNFMQASTAVVNATSPRGKLTWLSCRRKNCVQHAASYIRYKGRNKTDL